MVIHQSNRVRELRYPCNLAKCLQLHGFAVPHAKAAFGDEDCGWELAG
jgi:hypothetical protein